MQTDGELARRVHAMFTLAMEHELSQRREFVRSECVDDPALMARVLGLVDAADRSEAFLNGPALGAERGEVSLVPDAVGNYLVVGVLGIGGMATVYEAIQEQPKRRVALKVLHQSMVSSDAYLRFRFETETLARLQHPGIAQIYEAGAAHLGQPSPAPFFAMELVPDATSITEYAAHHDLPLRERLLMLASVCDAVHHGHLHGIIHRDLKPANILVDGEGHAKVIDFGIARTTEAGSKPLTAIAEGPHVIGTINYMSPEQCGGSSDIDIRADVYSLGVILYELACGRLPHDLNNIPLPAAIQRIVSEEPRRPEFPPSRLHRDLESIIFKAIDKGPERRYDSAAALASDLRCLLNHQPIDARPPGLADRCRLFAKRYRALVAAAISLAAGILLVAAVSTGFAFRLSEEVDRRRLAEQQTARERDRARWEAYTARIASALSAINTGEFLQARARLAASEYQPRGWEWGFLSRLAERSVSTIVGHDAMIMDLAMSADWSRSATAASDGSVRLWARDSQTPIATYQNETGARIFSIDFTWEDRSVVCGDETGVIRLLDGSDLHEIEVIAQLPGSVRTVVGLPGGRIAAAADSGTARIWTLDPRTEISLPADQPGGIRGLAVSPDGARLVTFNDTGRVWIRNSDDFSVLQRLEFSRSVTQVRFSDDGALIAAAGESGSVLVWDVGTGTLMRTLQATQGINTIRSIAFSHDGSMIAAGLTHRGILVFALDDGHVVGELGGHTDAVSAVSFQPDDARLLSASWDRSIRAWRTSEFASLGGVTSLEGHQAYVRAVAFSPDGSLVASVSRDGALRLWDPILARPVAEIPNDGTALNALAFSPDGRSVAFAGVDSSVRIVSTTTGRTLKQIAGEGSSVSTVAFDPFGQRIAAAGDGGTIHLWTLSTKDEPLLLGGHSARVNSVQFSPDGSVVASGSRDGTVRLWNANTGAELARLDGHTSDVFAVLFSHDGHRLFSGSRDQTVRVWDVDTGKPVATMGGHGQNVTCLAMNADGTRLAAGSWFGEIVLFDLATLDQIASFRAHDAAIRGIAFSPDGRWLSSCSYDRTIRLFDSVTREQADVARKQALVSHTDAERVVRPILDQAGGSWTVASDQLAKAGLDPERNPWIRKCVLSWCVSTHEESP